MAPFPTIRGSAAVLSLLSAAAWLWYAPEPDAPLHAAVQPASREVGGPASSAAVHAPVPPEFASDRILAEAGQPKASLGPRLRRSGLHHDWGEVATNEPVGHVFVLHNDGDAVLHILKLRPS